MTRHDIILDGDNLREAYGITLCKGSVANAISLPPFKEMQRIDWQEEDFAQVDASAPVFERKEFDVTLAGSLEYIDYWCAQQYHHYVNVTITNTPVELDKCKIERVTRYETLGALAKAVLRISSDDDPYDLLNEHDSASSFSQMPYETPFRFMLDGTAVDFGEIGIRVLKGWRDELNWHPDIKKPLERDISVVPAMICDTGGTPHFSGRRLSIQCLLHCGASIQEFWDRWLFFLYMSTRPGEIEIISGGVAGNYIYSGMSVNEYIPSLPVPWLKFTITFEKVI